MKIQFKSLIVLIVTMSFAVLHAQEYNPIHTAVPSLQITPDARGGAMGDVGAATVPDVYSQYWNAAKYPFIQSKAGIGLSYTPWLNKLVNDIKLMYVSGYMKFGNENLNALSASFRYFSLGDIPLTDINGDFWQNVSPHELAFDVAYSRKLTETFSGAVTLRYIHSDYSTGQDDETTPGDALAADIAGYNESYLNIGESESLLGFGFNISNIGSKMSSDGGNTSMFLPTNLRLGASLTYPINELNTIALSMDLNKLLVPTPPIREDGESDDEWQQRVDKYLDISPIAGIFKSFGDAPDGFSEELKEIAWSLGAEYTYDQKFSLRAGYFNENEYKGNRRYFTFGAGFNFKNSFRLDAAYLVSTAQTNPLDQTLRISLAFDIDGIKQLMK